MFNRQPSPPLREADVKKPIVALSEKPLGTENMVTPPPLPSHLKSVSGEKKGENGTLSIIGNDLAIMGERIVIITKGTLQVDGEVQADLHGAEVIIGEQGKVTGTIWADAIEVRGEVHGTIKGSKVQLMGKSVVEGDIHHQTLVVIEGANFDGRVRRPQDAAELKPKLEPGEHAKPAASLTPAPPSNGGLAA